MLLRIGIVGDFSAARHSHWATEAALFHAAARAGHNVEPHWVSTPSVLEDGGLERLAGFHGLWGAPGSPYVSMPGMLRAIEYAREHDVPYLGTCGGFQYALIEFTRNVLGIADADSAENDQGGDNVVITPLRCDVPDGSLPGPRLAGESTVRPVAGTRLARLCGQDELRAEYFCSFDTNPDFIARWHEAGLRVAALGPDDELRAFELPALRYFLATLFQPQLSSAYASPHPLVLGFLAACASTGDLEHGDGVIDETTVEVDGSCWRVAVERQGGDHHVVIERDGRLVVEHQGSLPNDWPGVGFPSEVLIAVGEIRQRMSWD